MDSDTPLRVDEHCPNCGYDIVYNGNYFCVHCYWALGEEARRAGLDKEYAALLSEGKIHRVSF